MKIEVGQFYKTRDGRKVRIYRTDAHGREPIHGYIEGVNVASWAPDGRYMVHREDCYDIVSEWVEPRKPVEGWVNIYCDGPRAFFFNKSRSR